MNVERKKVLVTGAQGSLGQAVVERFLHEQFEVTATLFSSQKSTQLQNQKNVSWVKVDLTHSESVRKLFLNQSFDILIHCAGGFRYTFVDQIKDDELEYLFNVNLKSAFYIARALLPEMKRKNFGRMIFVSTSATLDPKAGMAPYLASKAGLNMLTQSLAKEVSEFDININAVLPSIIDTPTNRKDMPNSDFSKWVTPAELADIIFSLVSPSSKSINGALLPVVGRV